MCHIPLFKGKNDSRAVRVEFNSTPVVLDPGSDQAFKVEHILEY